MSLSIGIAVNNPIEVINAANPNPAYGVNNAIQPVTRLNNAVTNNITFIAFICSLIVIEIQLQCTILMRLNIILIHLTKGFNDLLSH